MKQLTEQTFTGERALFKAKDVALTRCVFADGESPLKESRDVEAYDCDFKWKYPLWYSNNVKVENCRLHLMARAGVWYTNNITVQNTVIDAPKNFRRSQNITITNVDFTDAEETLWNCCNVTLTNVTARRGAYLAMNCCNVTVDNLDLDGDYAFDGAKNVTIRNSKLLTKDAFWNSENVTVYDSYISGEYLGWNAKNLTLVNCTISSLQGMCYISNLKLVNCKLGDTSRAFEYCTVDAEIDGDVESIINPISGRIVCDSVGALVRDDEAINPDYTTIICRKQGK